MERLYLNLDGAERFLSKLKEIFSAKSHKHTKSDITDLPSTIGSITEIKMNGSSKGTSGVVDLGTVLTSGSQTTTSTADGGSNVYTFSDGSTITVKNGSKGSTGADGVTPTIKATSGSNIGVVGTPSVTASTSGTTTTFTFNNLKGEKGEKGDAGTNATTTAVATTSSNGLMSSTDKSKLDGIATGANKTTVDTALSSTSTNPVQNKVVNTALADKANASHTHGNSDITSLDASKITSGTISIDRLPQGALERLTVVTDDTARFKLTSSDVQKGDTVKVTSTGKMYYVVDETKLSTETGYEVYAAGTAASVPWSGVTDKPSTYTPSSHTHTKSQITDFPTIPTVNNPTITITQAGSTKGTFTLNQSGNTTIALTDNNTTYSAVTTSANGLMSSTDKSKLDGIASGATAVTDSTVSGWGYKKTDTNTWIAFKGATTSAAGTAGYAPAPSAGAANRYLRSDGTWTVPPDTNTTYTLAGLMGSSAKGSAIQPVYWNGSAWTNTTYTLGKSVPSNAVFTDTTYSTATTSANGLMSSTDKSKLDGIASGANAYTHPTTSGNKHIPSGGSSGQILRWSADGTAVWGADNNTTYSTGTTSTSGLTKLYADVGTATDGTMTQAAIKTKLYDPLTTLKNETSYFDNLTIKSASWTNKTYSLYMGSSVKANSIINIYYDKDSMEYANSLDLEYEQSSGTIKFTANQTPTKDIIISFITVVNPSIYSSPAS